MGLRLSTTKQNTQVALSSGMNQYCEQDTYANLTLYNKIMSKAPSHESVELEHEFAGIIRAMEPRFPLMKQLWHFWQSCKSKAERGKLQEAFKPWKLKNRLKEIIRSVVIKA